MHEKSRNHRPGNNEMVQATEFQNILSGTEHDEKIRTVRTYRNMDQKADKTFWQKQTPKKTKITYKPMTTKKRQPKLTKKEKEVLKDGMNKLETIILQKMNTCDKRLIKKTAEEIDDMLYTVTYKILESIYSKEILDDKGMLKEQYRDLQ
jgi:hypothetical protein